MDSRSEQLVVVRVDRDRTDLALIARASGGVVEALRVPGGLAAVDARLLDLVGAITPGGLPDGDDPRLAAARVRLGDAIGAARMRLLDEDATLVPVRFPGRMTFASLERGAAAEALAPETSAIATAVERLAGAAPSVVALDGVAAVPGLLDALPGGLVDVGELAATALAAALDAADPEVVAAGVDAVEADTEVAEADALGAEPPEPSAEPAPAAAVEVAPVTAPAPVTAVAHVNAGRVGTAPVRRPVPRALRLWPVAAAAVVVVGLGGTAAAMALGAAPASIHAPQTGVTEQPGTTSTGAPVSGTRSTAPAPTTGATPEPGGSTARDARKTTTGTGSGAGAGDSTVAPPTVAAPAPDPTPTTSDGPSPDPTPTDSGSPSPDPTPTDSGSPSPEPTSTDGLGGILAPILP